MTASARAGAQGVQAVPGVQGPLPVGSVVGGRFTLERATNVEAQASVYLARDAQSGDAARIVILPFEHVHNRGVLAADLARAQRLRAPGLLPVRAYGEHDGFAWVATDVPDGHSLREVVDGARQQGRTVGAKAAHGLLAQVAQALTAAYEALAHGALTPASIYVGRSGRIVVADLGIARACPAMAWRGQNDPAASGVYAAPEISQGAPPSAATDVFALGVILYELLVGAPPTQPYQPASQVAAEVPPGTDGLLARALAGTSQARQPTPAALVDELGAALAGSSAASSGALPQLTPVSGLAVQRVTGRTFNAAAAAGLDADTERWLIQKNRLDYGPYSMAQVMAELERGTFGLGHTIIDTDSGERWPIGEHPQLAEFAKQAERKLEQVRRAQAEQSLEKVEKKKSRVTVFVVGAAIAVVGAGLGLYLKNRGDAAADTLASRVGEADIDAFLKNVKIGFAQPKRPGGAVRRGGGAKSAGGGDDFSNDMVLGDVTKGGGDEVLSENDVQQVMMANYRRLVPCIMEEKRRSPSTTDFDMDFVVLGSGKVSKVRVNGQQNGPLSSCLLGRMPTFRKFNGAKSIASWSMSVR
jgi:serine/threonine protein kinase